MDKNSNKYYSKETKEKREEFKKKLNECELLLEYELKIQSEASLELKNSRKRAWDLHQSINRYRNELTPLGESQDRGHDTKSPKRNHQHEYSIDIDEDIPNLRHTDTSTFSHNDDVLFETPEDISNDELTKIIPAEMIVITIEALNKFSNSEDIRKQIKIQLNNSHNVEAAIVKKYLSQKLNHLLKNKVLANTKIHSGTQNTFWGLPSWLNDSSKIRNQGEENIKSEYIFDANKIKGLKYKFQNHE